MVGTVEARLGSGLLGAVAKVAQRARQSRRLSGEVAATNPTGAAAVAERLLAELRDGEAGRLASYFDSASFEQAAFNLALQRLLVGGHRQRAEELLAAVRADIFQSLRSVVGLPPERATLVCDLVLRDLTAAIGAVGMDSSVLASYGVLDLAARGYNAASALRKSEFLTSVSTLAGYDEFAATLRRQVAAGHSRMRLPHLKSERASVPFETLYIQPTFPTIRGPYDRASDPWTADWTRMGQRSVVLGDPGAGKSTFAAKLAHDLADGQPDPGGETLVPFLVVLREFITQFQHGGRGLIAYLEQRCRSPYNVDPPPGAVEHLLFHNRAVLILDGLDELTVPALRRQVVELIESFVHQFPMTPVVVTSRLVGYDEVPLNADLFQKLPLNGFSDHDVTRYAQLWFANEAHDRPAAGGLAPGFIKETYLVPDLRKNPLMLSLLCGLYAVEHMIPDNRPEIYERCAMMLFQNWDQLRGVAAAPISRETQRLVSYLAWLLLQRPADSPTLLRSAMVDEITRYLLERKVDDEAVARGDAEGFLEVCAGRAWILTEVGTTPLEPLYGFTHRTFLEYFAADYLVKVEPHPDQVFGRVAPLIVDDGSSEVPQLALQILDKQTERGADRFLDLVVEHSRAAADRRVRARLAHFAARSLEFVQPSPTTLSRIVELAVDLAVSVPAPDRVNRVRIVESDAPLFAVLAGSSPTNQVMIRRATRRALAARIDSPDALIVAGFTDAFSGADLTGRVGPTRFAGLSAEILADASPDALDRAWWSVVPRSLDDPAALLHAMSTFGPDCVYRRATFGRRMSPSSAAHIMTATIRLLHESPQRWESLVGQSEALWTGLWLPRSALDIPGDLLDPQFSDAAKLITAIFANRRVEALRGHVLLCLPALEHVASTPDAGRLAHLAGGAALRLVIARRQRTAPDLAVLRDGNRPICSPRFEEILGAWMTNAISLG